MLDRVKEIIDERTNLIGLLGIVIMIVAILGVPMLTENSWIYLVIFAVGFATWIPTVYSKLEE